VDFVVAFDEDTPPRNNQMIKPDVIVKGGDYTEDQVVGKELTKSLYFLLLILCQLQINLI
jgi:D-beta-D-heptose 7-phosphate kinase/D-beta-D-heptose 1-phosphate adenosyltransferase